MTICERMFATLDEKGKIAADLCRVLGVGTSQTTSWKKRNVDPPAKYLIQIADFLDVSLEYLLSGKGEKQISQSPLEKEMLDKFRMLPEDRQQRVIGVLDVYVSEYDSELREDADVSV